MATIQIYEEESNKYFQVSATIGNTVIDVGNGSPKSYLKISTSIKSPSGASLGEFTVTNLGDNPPGDVNVYTNFTDLFNAYVSYYIAQGELGQSSSSSSSSSSRSSSSSSSSSSRLYSLSSISSISSNSSSSSSQSYGLGNGNV